jgi:predicted TIM-barrel fold metal-dependent hydrolase
MSYASGRTLHDADAHVMETPDWLVPWADPSIRARLQPLLIGGGKPGEAQRTNGQRRRHHGPAEGWRAEREPTPSRSALGACVREERSRALDLLGFSSQLVFGAFLHSRLLDAEHEGDVRFAYGLARAHNRALADFCAVDRRLLPVAYVPLADFALAFEMAVEAIATGANALLVSSACPAGHSPSHVRLFPVWEVAQEARVPIVFHVGGGGGRLLDPNYLRNGLPPVPDEGGTAAACSVYSIAIPFPPMQTLATLIVDGVLDRFPDLRIGVIAQGAAWLPSWMRQLDAAHAAFYASEERLRRLALRPSEYVTRQIRVTPSPTEPVGWIIEQVGEEICLFSSDYPHLEGGWSRVQRFEEHLSGVGERARQRFYCDNFVDLIGPALAAEPERDVPVAAT